MIWYSHLLQNFPQFVVIHTVKNFGIVNKAEVNVFLQLSCFFNDPTDVGILISGSSTFSKSSLNIWKFTGHLLLSLVWRILSITLLVCEKSAVVWYLEHSLALPFLGLEWKLTLSSPVAPAEFSKFAGILSATLSQHHLLGFEIAQLEFHCLTGFVHSHGFTFQDVWLEVSDHTTVVIWIMKILFCIALLYIFLPPRLNIFYFC